MGKLLKLFIILCTLKLISGLKYNPGCISKSKLELEHDNYDKFGWPWSEVHIGVWVPKKTKKSFLDISIEYKGLASDEAHERIKIYRKKTVCTSGHQHESNETTVDHTIIKRSWARFVFSIKSDVMGIYKSDDDHHLFELPLRAEIENIVIEGSNLTINCEKDFPIWWVMHNGITIPLESSTYSYHFTFYSTTEFTPAMKFDKAVSDILLGMSTITNETSTDDADTELLPHTGHTISTKCRENDDANYFKCDILNSNNSLIEFFKVPETPKFVKIFKAKQDSQEDFLVTMFKEKIVELKGSPETMSNMTIAFITTAVGCLILLVTTVALLIVLVLNYIKNKKLKMKNTDVEGTSEKIENKEMKHIDVRTGDEQTAFFNKGGDKNQVEDDEGDYVTL